MGFLKNYLGYKNTTKQGYKFEVIEYNGYGDVTIQFENDVILKTTFQSCLRGNIKNPLHATIYNHGCIGVGQYNTMNSLQYPVWNGILRRVYSKEWHDKKPTYEECSLCEEWHNFQTFAKWFDENYYTLEDDVVTIDKDIVKKGNKCYCPEYCVFVPRKLNSVLTKTNRKRGKYPIGVSLAYNKYKAVVLKYDEPYRIGLFDTPLEAFKAYKYEKEKHLKQLAEEYKHIIPEKAYQGLINYQVEITD